MKIKPHTKAAPKNPHKAQYTHKHLGLQCIFHSKTVQLIKVNQKYSSPPGVLIRLVAGQASYLLIGQQLRLRQEVATLAFLHPDGENGNNWGSYWGFGTIDDSIGRGSNAECFDFARGRLGLTNQLHGTDFPFSLWAVLYLVDPCQCGCHLVDENTCISRNGCTLNPKALNNDIV